MIYKIFNKVDSLKKKWQVLKKRQKIFSKNRSLKNYKIKSDVIQKFKNRWSAFGKPSAKWLKIYAGINNIISPDYVPENYYYVIIEPRLNNLIYSLAYADKNLYTILIPENVDVLPKTFLRKINGVFYENGYKPVSINEAKEILKNISHKEIIIKPSSDSAGGRNVSILRNYSNIWYNKEQKFDLQTINQKYPTNLILQEKINQHSFYKSLNESSVNTVRIFTYRSVKDNKIHILHSIIRVGKPGQEVDNQASGGYSIGVDNKGYLNSFAVNKYGNKTSLINNLDLKTIKKAPGIENMHQVAKKIAPAFFYNRLLAFDFCLDEQGNVKLLEVNLKNIEINFLQMNNGPLFGNKTAEIIDYCKTAPKSINFDFYV